MFKPIKLFFFSQLLILLFISKSHSIFSSNPAIFGIELDKSIYDYEQINCFTDHDFNNLGLDNFLLVSFSKKSKTGPNWTEWIYSESELPVTEGCVNPQIINDEFFNFKTKIYPKSKKIYSVSAIYKKVYKYNINELKTLLPIPSIMPDPNNPKQFIPINPDRLKLDVKSTQCLDRAKELINLMKRSQGKKGYRFSSIRMNLSDTGYTLRGKKGLSGNNYPLLIESKCTLEGNNNNSIENKPNILKGEKNFLVSVGIYYEESQTNLDYQKEVDLIKESMRGNKNNSLNTDGL